MDSLCSPQNSFAEDLIPNMTIFRDRVFKELIKVKSGYKGGALI